ncbi:MAG: hypothetical protein ACI9DJ_000405 [Algoriphagus sp.]|jgi:hypothetical protein
MRLKVWRYRGLRIRQVLYPLDCSLKELNSAFKSHLMCIMHSYRAKYLRHRTLCGINEKNHAQQNSI